VSPIAAGQRRDGRRVGPIAEEADLLGSAHRNLGMTIQVVVQR
jgi:hypothetical protein